MIYVVSPYSHEDKRVEEERFERVVQHMACLARDGLYVYSPIAHWHPIAIKHDMPTDFTYYRKVNEDMIRRAASLLLIKMSGWQISRGVGHEVEFARERNIPIYTMDDVIGATMERWDVAD